MAGIRDSGLPWTGDERERARYPRSQFWLHLRPARVLRANLRWTHTFGLGGSALVLLLALVTTGTLQLLVYQPATGGAWQSVRELEHSVAFGTLVRGIHYWSANLLLVVMVLHLLRVLLTGAFRGVRAVNWLIGVGGHLRRLALGSEGISDVTLVRFATFPTTVLPVLIAGFAAWHFWRVRRAGGVIPASEDPERVTFFPHLFVRELGQAAVLVALVVALAESVWVVLSFLRPRRRGGDAGAPFVAGGADQFATGSVTAFPEGKFYLVRLDDGGFLALHREGTHLGCTVPWDEGERKTICRCHASSYGIRGVVLTSPAPRLLDWLPVRIENGIVKVVAAGRQRRSEFRLSQVQPS